MVKFTRFLSVILCALAMNTYGEGTKELRPSSGVYADLYISGTGATAFAKAGCLEKYRLNIHVSAVGETILFGFHYRTGTSNYTLKKPHNAGVAITGACPTSGAGYIVDYNQAVIGPYPGSFGYTPIAYVVTNIADTGDYYIEFSNNPSFSEFDIQVVTGANTPAQPYDALNGRVWSGAWQLYADLNTSPRQKFSGKLYIFSDDGIVTSCRFDQASVGLFSIFCNPYGCLNTGNFGTDRQSRSNNTSGTFPGIAQYRIFLNNPDIVAYPSGVYGTMIGTPTIIPDPGFPPCSGEKLIVVNVNKAGNVEILIDVPYGDATYDVSLFSNVLNGTNNIPWNGKDGHGTPVPDGTFLTITVTYVNGLTNLPIWDQEQNPNGYFVTLERPINPSVSTPKTYWDDSNIGGGNCPGGSNLAGCTPAAFGCHTWASDCHDKMINTWWYSASSSTANIDMYHTGTPPLPSALPQWGCGAGCTINLSASVANTQQTVRWWDQPTGGNLLYTGSPYTVILPAVGVYHYYAEAYNPTSSCTSTVRLDVVAEAVAVPPAPVALGAPFYSCGPGTVTLVTTNTNPSVRIDWYDDATPPTKLGSGNSFTTPIIAATTTYYAEAVEFGSPAGCSSATRSQFIAEVRPSPQNTNPQPSAICTGTTFALVLTGSLPGTLHSWTATCNPPGAVTGFTATQAPPIASINDLLLNSTTGNATVTYTVTPHSGNCIGTPTDLTVTVKPTPHFLNTAPLPICGLALFNMPLISDVTGSDFTWTATCSPVGAVTGFTAIQVTGVTLINDMLTNTTAAPATVTYSVTPHAFGCDGPIVDYTVTLQPTPHLTNTAPTAICSESPFAEPLLSDVSGTDFTWTATSGPVGAVTGFTAVQAIPAALIDEAMLTNTTANTATVTYHITPHANGCSGPVTDFIVTVKPTPHLTNSPPSAVCSEGIFNVTLLPDVTGGDFTWTASCSPAGAVTGFTAIQISNVTLINETLTNLTSAFASVTYHITPHSSGCDGPASDLTVTVNPTPHLTNGPPSPICSGTIFNENLVPDVTGGTFTWTATCAPVGDVTGFTANQVLPVTLINEPLTNSTATFATVTYHVTPHANNCQGVPADYTITIKPTPHLTNGPPPAICSGTVFSSVLIPDVTGGAFTWTATCSPAGAITGFTASQNTNVTTINELLTNTTSAFATVTYHISAHANGCDGPGTDYTVTVKPTPHLTNTTPPAVCSAGTFNTTLQSDVTGGSFTWTATCNPAGVVTGFTASQVVNTNLINDILTSNSNTFAMVTYHLIPHANGCNGPASDLTVTVNPTPHLTNSAPAPICSGSTFSITLNPDVAGGNFTWTASSLPVGSVTGYTTPQSTNTTTINDILVNSINTVAAVTYHITPHANGCSGSVTDFSVNVNPVAAISCLAGQSICSGTSSAPVTLTSTVAGTNFSWSATCLAGSVNPCPVTPGTANPVTPVTFMNVTNIQQTVTYTITSSFQGCPGTTTTHDVTINPSPTVTNWPLGQTICSGNTSSMVGLTATVIGTTFTWTASTVSPISGFTTSGTDNIPAQTLFIPAGSSGFVTYHIIPSFTGGTSCPGAPTEYKINVNPLPTPVISGSTLVCELQPNVTYTTPLIIGHSYNWTVTGASVVANANTNAVTVTWGPYTASPGTVTVTETIDATGCPKTTAPYSVTLQQRPVPSLNGPLEVCDGVAGKVYQTEAGMANYSWTISGGSITSGGGAGSPTATVTWNVPGNKWIEVNYVNALGCPGFPSKQLPVTVHVLPNTLITEGSGPNCESASHIYSVPADPQCTYAWTVTPAGRGLISGGQGTSTVTIDWQTFGSATIAVTGTNTTTTCVSSSTHLLTVHPKPLPSFSACFELLTTPGAKKFTLRGATPYVAGQGVYSGNRVSLNAVSGNYEFDPFGASAGAYPVTYTFTNNYGCTASAGPVTINVQNTFFNCGGDLTDIRDGKKYQTSMVGGRCWMTQNLAYGTTLDPPSQPQTDNCVNEKYCLPSDPACSGYGALYQWDELMRYGSTSANQGICPPEWHIPSETEWQLLINNISAGVPSPADALAAGFLKDPLLNPGFFSLFEGLYYLNNTWSFSTGNLTATMYWTSTINSQNRPLARGANFYNPSVSRYWSSRENSFSVRCLKDLP